MTICLSAYNAAIYLKEAIESILSQSYANFEFFIINDCSTDNSGEIIKTFSDSRIKFLEHQHNLGLAQSRQEVIDQASGKYLFWMDADDISHPSRISQQVKAMEANTDLVVCGTNAFIISDAGDKLGTTSQPVDNSVIKAGLLFGFPFTSPTVGVRLQRLKDINFRWAENIRVSEDYILYSSLFNSGSFANLSDALYYYRVHEQPNRITSFKNSTAIIDGRKIAWRNLLKNWDLNASDAVLHLHDKLTYYRHLITREDIGQAKDYLRLLASILEKNYQHNIIDQELLQQQVKSFSYMLVMHPALSLGKARHILKKFTEIWDWFEGEQVFLKKGIKLMRDKFKIA